VRGSVKVHGQKPSTPEVSIKCGGVMTIRNTGREIIRAGDLLFWDFPRRLANGKVDPSDFSSPSFAKDGKIPVVVRRYNYANSAAQVQQTVQQYIADLAATPSLKATTANGGKLITSLAALVNAVNTAGGASIEENVASVLGSGSDVAVKFIAQLLAVECDVKNRVFARALSSAPPAHNVDIAYGVPRN
jgi:hypothetical protein